MYVRYSGRHLFFLFRHVLLFMEREGASPRLPPVDLPSHTMQPKTADPLRAGISRALHIPLGQIKPATCCSIKSSSLMSHRLIMSLWDRRREKKDEGRRRVDCLGENSFSFPPTGEIFGEQLFRLL
jgi:hypothetical protein